MVRRRLLVALACLFTAAAVAPASASANDAPTCYGGGAGRVDNDIDSYVYFQCSDADSDPLTYAVVDRPAHGTLGEITTSGTNHYVKYTPADGYVGEDHLTYNANDGTVDSEVVTYSFTVANPTPPTCDEPLPVTIRPDTEWFFALEYPQGSDGCQGSQGKMGEFLDFRITLQPAHGKLTVNGSNGHPTYTPDAGYSGPDEFRYVAVGSGGDSNEVTQQITIDPNFNRKPVCFQYDAQTPTLRVGAKRDFILACSDPDRDPITYSFDKSGTRGTVSDPAQMQPQKGFPGLTQLGVTYTAPAAVGDGTDSFSYYATDDRNAVADPVFVQDITVRAADYNTAPHCPAPYYTPSIEAGGSGYLTTSCIDDEEDPITYELVSQATHGHVILQAYEPVGGGPKQYSFQYDSNEHYLGDDSFQYRASDDRGAATDPETVAVKVVKPSAPQCFGQDQIKLRSNSSKGVMLLCMSGGMFMSGGKPPTYSIVRGPAHGTLSAPSSSGSGQVVYTPDHDFEGEDSFTFKASNAAGDSNVAEQKVLVAAGFNTKPACFGNFIGDRVRSGSSRTINIGCYDFDGDPLTYSVTQPAHGHLGPITPPPADLPFGNATAEYTPDPGYLGNDSFTIKANDGIEDSDPAKSLLNVVEPNVNTVPQCWSWASVKVAANSSFGFGKDDLSCWDPDADPLTYTIVTQPQHGTLSAPDSHGARRYTPTDPTWTGDDSFTYKANDGFADGNQVTVVVRVTDPVDVVAEPATLPSGEPVNLQNYVDSNGKSLISVPSGDVRQFPGGCMPLDVDTNISPGSGSVDNVRLVLDPAAGGADKSFQMTHGTGDAWGAHIDCVKAGDLSVEWDFTENGTTTPLSKPLGGIVLIDPQGVVYDKDRYDAAVSTGKTPAEARTAAAIEGATVELQRQSGIAWTKVPSGDPGISPNVNPELTGIDGLFQWDVSAGTYRVVVSKPGYTTVTSAGVSVPPPATNLDIAMTRVAGGAGGDDGGDNGGGGTGATQEPPATDKPADSGPAASTPPPTQTIPNPPHPAPKPACSGLKGKKKAQCESKERLKKALSKCSKLKGKKKAVCVKRAKARAKCDSLTGRKKTICLRRANTIGARRG